MLQSQDFYLMSKKEVKHTFSKSPMYSAMADLDRRMATRTQIGGIFV